jgi:NAD(P)-dependent dehydrogenase (short-subunit alcohol dehydrogenase family)
LGIAECCLANGAAKIYSIDITETGDDFAVIEKRFPGRVFAVQADVTKEDSVTAAVDKIIEESGALHGMVVNAGRTNHKSALDFTQAEIEALFNVNVCSISQKLNKPIVMEGYVVANFCFSFLVPFIVHV